MKICTKCHVRKNKKSFHRDRNRKDGLSLWCKPCACRSTLGYYHKNREQISAERRAEYAAWRLLNPILAPEPKPDTGFRFCAGCKTEKANAEFYRNRGHKNNLQSQCKRCIDKKNMVYAKKNPKQVRETYRRWMDKNREKDNLRRQLADFGLTEIQYRGLLQKQNSLCAICRRVMKPACIDHCHNTGQIRGLLCRPCNAGIGQLRDSLKLLQSAVEYLKQFPDGTIQKEKPTTTNTDTY